MYVIATSLEQDAYISLFKEKCSAAYGYKQSLKEWRVAHNIRRVSRSVGAAPGHDAGIGDDCNVGWAGWIRPSFGSGGASTPGQGPQHDLVLILWLHQTGESACSARIRK